MKATDRSKQCEQCKKTFYCPYGIGAGRWEKRKVCSKKCGAASRMTYNRCIECGKEFHRSNMMSRKKKTCSKECRAKTLSRIKQKELLTYSGVHQWISRILGKPQECSECEATNEIRLHWANIDHKYRKNKKDWINLCPKCHYQYDFEHNLRGNYA